MAANTPDYAALQQVVAETTAGLRTMLDALGPLSLGLQTAVGALGGLANSLAAGARAAEAANAALKKQSEAAEKAAQAAEDAYLKAKSYGGGTPELAKKAADSRVAADKAAAKAAEGVAAAGIALAPVFGAVVTGALAVIDAVKPLVQALSPALIQQFDIAFRNLQATIGVGFTGIFQAGIGLFRDIAQAVAPLFIALQPIVSRFADLVTGELAAGIGAVAALLQVFVPILSVNLALLAPIFANITGTLNLFATVLKIVTVLVESVFAAFGISTVEIAKRVTDAFTELIKGVVVATYALLRLAGFNETADRLKKAFTNQSSVAAGPTRITNLEQIGKDLALASVNAAQGGRTDATTADVVKELEGVDRSIKDLPDALARAIVARLPGGETAVKVWDETPDWAKGALGGAARLAVGPLGLLF